VKRSKPVVIACVSDIHAGGTTAVCPPSIALDDGGAYTASKAQQWLWGCWGQYWERVDTVRRELGAELYEVFNGDAVDGAHHKTTQILSENPNAQAAVWDACIRVPLALSPDRLVIIRGTEAHVGNSASAEERIATGLRKDKRPIIGDSETGTASHWHWRAEIQGVRLDFTHHGRTGQREHTRGSAAVLHAHDILLSHVKNGDDYPHLCLRAHYHKFNDSHDAAPVRVVTTGAWQLGTGFVHKVAADSLADIGGAIIVIRDGTYTVEKIHFRAARGPIWKP
jgi:hypothetical protein